MHILFVCTGNTCRSPMAAALAQAELDARGLSAQVSVDSCGLAAYPGESASPNAVTAAAEQGGVLGSHRAKPATPELLESADHIVCMSQSHAAAIAAALPELSGRITVFDPPIPDPFGGDLATYRRTAEVLRSAILKLFADWSLIPE